MAFSAEAKVKLGIDTADFEYGLEKSTQKLNSAGQKMQRILDQQAGKGGEAGWENAGKMQSVLEKKFGFKAIMKGLFKGVGLGTGFNLVTWMQDLIIRPSKVAAESAKMREEETSAILDNTKKEAAELGGHVAKTRILKKDFRDTTGEIIKQQKLVNELRSNPLTWISGSSEEKLLEAEKKLSDLRVKQANIGSELRITNVLEQRKLETIKREDTEKRDLFQAEMRHAGELEKMEIARQGLFKKWLEMKNRGASQGELAAVISDANQNAREQKLLVENVKERTLAIERQVELESKLFEIRIRGGNEFEELNARLVSLYKEEGELRRKNAGKDVIAKNLAEQKQVINAFNITKAQVKENIRELREQAALDDKITAITIRQGSEREKLQARLNALKKEAKRLNDIGARDDVKEANRTKQNEVRNQMGVLSSQSRQTLGVTYVSLGNAAAGKSTRRRGKTETERIAERGQKYEEMANEMILHGNKDGAAYYANLAVRDLRSAGKRVSDASSKIAPDVSRMLNSELVKANTTLTEIKANLDPAGVNNKAGGGK